VQATLAGVPDDHLHHLHCHAGRYLFIAHPPDERGELMIQCGYDLIREESLPAQSFLENLPP